MSEVCITITGVRKPGLNESDFHAYITTHHAPLAMPFLLKYGIKEYTLVLSRVPFSFSLLVYFMGLIVQVDDFGACRSAAEEMQMSRKLAEYDYVVQFVMDDLEQFKRLWGDEEFRKSVKPDHVNFADENRSGLVFLFLTASMLTCQDINRISNEVYLKKNAQCIED